MRRYKVAVAGCGPAGLATALLLHRRGHAVELFERFSEPRPVGSGLMLQPTGMAVLEHLGLASAARRSGSSITRLRGRSSMTGNLVLDVRYAWLGAGAPNAVGIHRSTLFDILFDAVKRDRIPVTSGREIETTSVVDEGRLLVFADGSRSQPFDLVVDAMGMRSPLAEPCGRQLAYGALWATVDWPAGSAFDQQALEQRYRRANVMVGLMPTGTSPSGRQLGTFFWSLKGSQLGAWKASGLDAWKSQVRATWAGIDPVLDQLLSDEQLTFAHYSHRTLRRPAGARIFHLGDAWHSTSPQLGQGANMAFLDAYALASAIDAVPTLSGALARAVKLRRTHVRLYQALSLALTPFYQSDSRVLPGIRDLLVPHIAKIWPATWIQAAMVSGLLGDPLSRLGLNPVIPIGFETRGEANA